MTFLYKKKIKKIEVQERLDLEKWNKTNWNWKD